MDSDFSLVREISGNSLRGRGLLPCRHREPEYRRSRWMLCHWTDIGQNDVQLITEADCHESVALDYDLASQLSPLGY